MKANSFYVQENVFAIMAAARPGRLAAGVERADGGAR